MNSSTSNIIPNVDLLKSEVAILVSHNLNEIRAIEAEIAPQLERLRQLKERVAILEGTLMEPKDTIKKSTKLISLDNIHEHIAYKSSWSWYEKAEFVLRRTKGNLTIAQIVEELKKQESSLNTSNARVGVTNALNVRVDKGILKEDDPWGNRYKLQSPR